MTDRTAQPAQPGQWPIVVGVFAIVFGLLGLLGLLGTVNRVMMPWMLEFQLEMMRAMMASMPAGDGADISAVGDAMAEWLQFPGWYRWFSVLVGVASAVVCLGYAWGGFELVQRRARGRVLFTRSCWASIALHLVILVSAFATGSFIIVMMSAQGSFVGLLIDIVLLVVCLRASPTALIDATGAT